MSATPRRKKKSVKKTASTARTPRKKKSASSERTPRKKKAASTGRGRTTGAKKRPTAKKKRPSAKKHRPRAGAKSAPRPKDQPERLQKVMASAGIGSRRECEELITSGRVEIDRQVVTELGTRVDPLKQEIRLDGEVMLKQKPVYIALNKPKGVLCTNRDPSGRARAIDLVPEKFGRLFPVGRLDMNSQGLILLTNDGELANRIVHPRYGLAKVYQVQVAGVPSRETIGKMREGIYLSDGFVQVASIKLKHRHKQSAVLEMTLEEGRNREIRRMLARLGHKVMTLTRVAVGPVRLGKLPESDYRQLTRDEIKELRYAVRD